MTSCDKIKDAASTLGKEIDKAGGEVGAEIAALPEQLEGLRRTVVTVVEPYRPQAVPALCAVRCSGDGRRCGDRDRAPAQAGCCSQRCDGR
jgi:hypothetical protein